jgi:hypothetical protein
MTEPRWKPTAREMVQTFRASPVFVLAVLITLALAALNAGMVVLMNVAPGFLPGALGRMTHFAEPHHRIHDLTFGFLFMPAVFGMLAQLRRPVANIAGALMALVPWTGLLECSRIPWPAIHRTAGVSASAGGGASRFASTSC